MAMGCLARDFLPSSISFSWKFQNNSDVSQGVRTFPTLRTGGKFTATSQVLLSPKNVLEGSDEYLVCKIHHGSKNKDLHVPLPGKSQPLPARGPGSGMAQGEPGVGWGLGQAELTPDFHSSRHRDEPQRQCVHPTPRCLLWPRTTQV